jgi:hypothetical protein
LSDYEVAGSVVRPVGDQIFQSGPVVKRNL